MQASKRVIMVLIMQYIEALCALCSILSSQCKFCQRGIRKHKTYFQPPSDSIGLNKATEFSMAMLVPADSI